MLCLSRCLIINIALVSIFAGCPQSNAPNLASVPGAVPKTDTPGEQDATRTQAELPIRDPILEDNYEAQLFVPSASAPISGPRAADTRDERHQPSCATVSVTRQNTGCSFPAPILSRVTVTPKMGIPTNRPSLARQIVHHSSVEA